MTVVEGDLKAPFSLATTPGVWEGTTLFPGLHHFTLDQYLIMVSVKQGGIKYNFFESLVWLDLRLNPGLPGQFYKSVSVSFFAFKSCFIYLSSIYFFILFLSKTCWKCCFSSINKENAYWYDSCHNTNKINVFEERWNLRQIQNEDFPHSNLSW